MIEPAAAGVRGAVSGPLPGTGDRRAGAAPSVAVGGHGPARWDRDAQRARRTARPLRIRSVGAAGCAVRSRTSAVTPTLDQAGRAGAQRRGPWFGWDSIHRSNKSLRVGQLSVARLTDALEVHRNKIRVDLNGRTPADRHTLRLGVLATGVLRGWLGDGSPRRPWEGQGRA